nr:hypothetical protein [Tanacetum cinerariifolium]
PIGQQSVGMQAIERGQQHALREIAGRSEQEQLGYRVTLHADSLQIEAGERIEPGHEIEVLHSGATGALAEIVERGDQPHMPRG